MLKSIDEILSKRIRARRSELGMTQQELAEKAALSVATIQSLERARVWVTPDSIGKLAKALKIEPSALFIEGEPNWEVKKKASAYDEILATMAREKKESDRRFSEIEAQLHERSHEMAKADERDKAIRAQLGPDGARQALSGAPPAALKLLLELHPREWDDLIEWVGQYLSSRKALELRQKRKAE